MRSKKRTGVEQRGSKWIIYWTGPDGKRQRHWPDPPIFHKAIAKQEAAKFAERLGLEQPLPDVKPGLRPIDRWDFPTLAQKWLAVKAEHSSSWDYAQSALRTGKALGVTRLDEITKEHVRAYREKKHAESNLRKTAQLLRWAVAEGQVVNRSVLTEIKPRSAGRTVEREADVELISEGEMQDIRAEAARRGQLPLIHCLALFGWRPISANLLEVRDVVLDAAVPTVTLRVKMRAEPFVHPIDGDTVRLLRPLVEGRESTERVFRNPRGEPWECERHPLTGLEISASQMRDWYRNVLKKLAPHCGNIYGLKRYALTAMHEGRPPWRKALSHRQIRLYSGHKTDSQVARYLRTNLDEAYDLLGGQGGQMEEISVKMHQDAGQKLAEVIRFPCKSGG